MNTFSPLPGGAPPPLPPCGFWVGLPPPPCGAVGSGLCSTWLLTKLPAGHCYHQILVLSDKHQTPLALRPVRIVQRHCEIGSGMLSPGCQIRSLLDSCPSQSLCSGCEGNLQIVKRKRGPPWRGEGGGPVTLDPETYIYIYIYTYFLFCFFFSDMGHVWAGN